MNLHNIAWIMRATVLVFVLGLTLYLAVAEGRAVWASTAATTLYVSTTTGVDAATCGTQATPCKSIQKAVTRAQVGDTIKVAAGVYEYPGSANPCYQYYGQMLVVVCAIDKQITLRGGYLPTDWATYAPNTNETIIDGGGRARGIYVAPSNPNQPARSNVTIAGFTVRNGFVQGANAGSDLDIFAFGGGMLSDISYLALEDVVFEDNIARGGSPSANAGGAGSGGGLALRSMVGAVTLANVVFRGNRAEGGQGPVRGGLATGGGLYTYLSSVSGSALTFIDNTAKAGNSTGFGKDAFGETADGTGGGATFQVGSTVELDGVVAAGNQALGGDAAQYAGGGFGGGLKFEGNPGQAGQATTVRIADAHIYDNLAHGADGAYGGLAQGGGCEGLQANVTIEDSFVYANRSTGGSGSTLQGAAGGGGITLGNIINASSEASILGSVIVANEVSGGSGPAAGGGGGGVWLQGVRATLWQNTIAGNMLLTSPMQGSGILILNDGSVGVAVVELQYNILADHRDAVAGNAALHVKTGNTANLINNVFANNNVSLNTSQVGVVNGMNTSVVAGDAGFMSPGAPAYDYNISFASPAVNVAVGSTDATDIDGDPRIGVPDAGAQEAAPFNVLVAPIDQGLNVQWGDNPGVLSYELGVTCPNGANDPNEVDCGATRSYPGDSTGTLLTGLTNYQRYGVTVVPVIPGGVRLSPAVVTATPTDLLVHIPIVTTR